MSRYKCWDAIALTGILGLEAATKASLVRREVDLRVADGETDVDVGEDSSLKRADRFRVQVEDRTNRDDTENALLSDVRRKSDMNVSYPGMSRPGIPSWNICCNPLETVT